MPLFCATHSNSNKIPNQIIHEQRIPMITHLTSLMPVQSIAKYTKKIKDDLLDVPSEKNVLKLRSSTPKSNVLSQIGSFSTAIDPYQDFFNASTIKPYQIKEQSAEFLLTESETISIHGKLSTFESGKMIESLVSIENKIIKIENELGVKKYPLQYYYAENDTGISLMKQLYYPIVLTSFDLPSFKIYASSLQDQCTWVNGINTASSKISLEEKYNSGGLIHSGSFGSVYIGTAKATKESVAIKIIQKKQSQVLSNQLKKEIDILRLCNHPNIVKFIDVLEYPYCIALVMEYLSGGSLKNCMEYSLSIGRIREIMDSVTSALFYLKEMGIVHRDIKLDNILFKKSCEYGEVKIVDFGLLSICEPQGMINGFVGTAEYLSPEVILKQKYDSKTDVWSLGVVFYMLLSGQAPFKGVTTSDLFNSILNDEPYYALIENNRGSLALKLLKKMLHKNPLHRISIEQIRIDPFFVNKEN